MDSKIVFDEHEYPTLSEEDIEFDTSDDLQNYRDYTKSNGTVPIVGEQIVANPENVIVNNTEKETTTASKNDAQSTRPLTRSKARKAAALAMAPSQLVEPIESDAVPAQPIQSFGSDMVSAHPIQPVESDVVPAQPIQPVESDLDSAQPVKLAKKRTRIDSNEQAKSQSSNKKKKTNVNIIDSDLEAVTSLTSFENEFTALHILFEKIVVGSLTIKNDAKNVNCVMRCGRLKATVFLPCKHQIVCNECFVLFKLYVCNKKKNMFCPLCKLKITSNIAISN